jgi:hypothetical protein
MYNTRKLTILIYILNEISNAAMRDFGWFFLPSYVTSVRYALQRYCTENRREKKIPERKLRGLSPNFYMHIYVSDLHISTIGYLAATNYSRTDPENK